MPTSREELIDWFESNFACVVGWPMSHTAEGEPPSIEELNDKQIRDFPGATRYEAYGLLAEDTDRGHAALAQALYRRFALALEKCPEIRGTRLYWRYQSKIDLGGGRVYTRIAIPCLIGKQYLPVHEEGRDLRSIHET